MLFRMGMLESRGVSDNKNMLTHKRNNLSALTLIRLRRAKRTWQEGRRGTLWTLMKKCRNI